MKRLHMFINFPVEKSCYTLQTCKDFFIRL